MRQQWQHKTLPIQHAASVMGRNPLFVVPAHYDLTAKRVASF